MRSLIPFWSELGLSARESQSISPALKSPPTRKVALVLWFEMFVVHEMVEGLLQAIQVVSWILWGSVEGCHIQGI